MTIHLIKLSVGPESLAELEKWQKGRLLANKLTGKKPELMHITRHHPKRAEEVIGGGSIYWVIKGFIVARQKVLDLRTVSHGGVKHCAIVHDRELIRVIPRPHRAFQGWRYLKPQDAPKDLVKGQIDDNMPEELLRELTELGLL